MSAITILWQTAGGRKPYRGDRDLSVLTHAARAGVDLESPCAGCGVCGRCTVFLGQGDYEIDDQPVRIGTGERREELACRVRVTSAQADIAVPSAAGHDSRGAQILDDTEPPSTREAAWIRRADGAAVAQTAEDSTPHVIDRVDAATRLLGLAIDIGTSTVAVALLDLETRAVVARASRFNQQMLRADDVASRIAFARDDAGLATLRDLVIGHSINPMVADLCVRARCLPRHIVAVAVAGNTVMAHLFLGLSPTSMGQYPYTPARRFFDTITGRESRLDIHPDARVHVVPAVAGYVGGDIVADTLVIDLERRHGLNLLVDIGTNGEMVLAEDGDWTACATAAGPAFEGAGLAHGCRAVAGAVSHIRIDADLALHCDIIGGGPARGFCGSAVVDFLAQGRTAGLINRFGRFDLDRLRAAGRYTLARGRHGESHACVLIEQDATALGESLWISEADVAQVLKAKGAIYAGLKTLLQARGRHPRDLDKLILAGGFARYLDYDSAVRAGLLPELPREKVEIAGNGSLAGAMAALCDRTAIGRLRKLADKPRVLELNREPCFANFFAEALALPYLEPDEFPHDNGED